MEELLRGHGGPYHLGMVVEEVLDLFRFVFRIAYTMEHKGEKAYMPPAPFCQR